MEVGGVEILDSSFCSERLQRLIAKSCEDLSPMDSEEAGLQRVYCGHSVLADLALVHVSRALGVEKGRCQISLGQAEREKDPSLCAVPHIGKVRRTGTDAHT